MTHHYFSFVFPTDFELVATQLVLHFDAEYAVQVGGNLSESLCSNAFSALLTFIFDHLFGLITTSDTLVLAEPFRDSLSLSHSLQSTRT